MAAMCTDYCARRPNIFRGFDLEPGGIAVSKASAGWWKEAWTPLDRLGWAHLAASLFFPAVQARAVTDGPKCCLFIPKITQPLALSAPPAQSISIFQIQVSDGSVQPGFGDEDVA